MTKAVFQARVESPDTFTKDFEYPVNETTGFRGEMKVVKYDNEEEELASSGEEGEDQLEESWEFDWKCMEEILKEVEES